MQEIIQPYGATKKPPESMLASFAENCRNLDSPIIVAIVFYFLNDENSPWLSKMRALYALEFLLKNKKYFDTVKHNLDKFKAIDFEDAVSQNQSGGEQILKLRSAIIERVSKNFDDSEPKPVSFDLSKLDSLKEKSNAKFFEKMENLKKGKGKEGDLIEAQPTKTTTSDKNDIFGLDLHSTTTAAPKKTVDPHDDLLGLATQTVLSQQQSSVKTKSEDLFDFTSVTHTAPQKSPEQQNEIVFEKNAVQTIKQTAKTGDLVDAFNIAMEIRKEAKSEQKDKNKDLFDFIQ